MSPVAIGLVQQHRHGAGSAHRDDARFAGVFDVVG